MNQRPNHHLALLIFVKYPDPGKVKTRLAATVGAGLAAQLYSEFIRCTLAFAEQIEVGERFVAFTPAEKEPELRALFPGTWQWFAQIDSPDLGVRIHHAIAYVQQCGCSHVLAIGTDSPSLPVIYLNEAAAALSTHDLVLGPARDGGYYLIGLKTAPPQLFTNVDWSTERVLQQTLKNAGQLQMAAHQLPAWYDVDDLEALKKFCRDGYLSSALREKVNPFLENAG